MKILSNGKFNISKNYKNKISAGGPMVFEEKISSFFIAQGNEWVGVSPQSNKSYFDNLVKSKIQLHNKKNNKSNWIIYLDSKKTIIITKGNNLDKINKAIKELTKVTELILDEEKPDLVFLNGFSLFNGLLMKAALNKKIPIVVQHAGIWAVELEIYKDMFSKEGLRVLKLMEKDLGKYSTKNIFLTEFSKNVFYKKAYKVKEEKVAIVPLPFSAKEVIKKIKAKNTFDIGIVARWDRIKNHKAILDIATEAKKQKKNWDFYAVTKIPESNVNADFKKQYKENINVIEQMENKKLNSFYQKMDLMLLPSLFDVSPHVVAEALFVGTPTLISNNVGLVDYYARVGETNFIDDFKNIKKVVEKIEKLKTTKISKKLLPLIKKESSEKKVFAKYLKIFKDAIKER